MATQPGKTTENKSRDKLLLDEATKKLSAETQRADEAEKKLADAVSRADSAEGQASVFKKQLETALAERIDGDEITKRDATIVSLQNKVKLEKARADQAAEPARLKAAVKKRVALETSAGMILGDMRLDGFDDRELMDVVIERLTGKKTEPERSDDYARACFDTATEQYIGSRDALVKLSEIGRPRDISAPSSAAGNARDKMIERNLNASKPRQ